AHAGSSKRCRTTSPLVARHGRPGATAMRNSSARPIGVVMRSKYGSPTDKRLPRSAWAIKGKTVPSSTTNASPANNRLLARNGDGVDERGSGDPRQQRRVLDRVPRPEPAPPQHLVAPPRAEDDADRQEAPRDQRRPARVRQPPFTEPPGDERTDREHERHGEA